MDSNSSNQIIMYGTVWCGDTRRARAFLDQHEIPYVWIDIDKDPQARKHLEALNNGFRSVPTLVFPDGSKLVEPNALQLAEKLGIPQP